MKPGDAVRVVDSLLYTGRFGTLTLNSGEPDDPWDWGVLLDDGRRIGVDDFQVIPA